jgi:serine/threonine-protein kinase
MSPGICEYFIREKIAEGGQAVVFLCRKRSGGPPVAIKVLQTEKAVQRRKQQRFMREIDVMAKLDHPNVVRLIEFGSHEKIFFFIMEHMAGGSIMDLFKERGPLPLEQVMTMMRQTLEGLDYIHREGYIHRDIKPQNLLLTKKDNGLVKIADMGVAKNIQQSGLIDLTQTGTTMGSIFHMAREQLTDFKNVTSAADVWGVASTFYRMLTGQHVYDFSVKRQPITAVLEGAIVPIGHRNPQLPAALCDLFDRALAIDTDTRYKDAAEFLGALEQLPS